MARLVAQALDATAAANPAGAAIVHGDRRLTWAEVRERSVRVAEALLASGMRRGDHIAVWMPNHPDWLLLWLGAVRIGVTMVPINTRYKPDEAAYVLRKADARMLFMEDAFLGIDYPAHFAGICPDWGGERGSKELPELREVVLMGPPVEGMTPFEQFLARSAAGARALPAAESAVTADDVVIIVFTSGTTGFPKGVMHTHDVVRMIETVAAWFDLRPSDRVLGHLPLFHVAGVMSSFGLALIAGGTLVQLDHWNPERALELIQAEGITMFSGIPTHFIDLINHPRLGEHDVSSLRTGWIGGSSIPPEVVRGARERLGMEAILPVYGMTELTSCTTLGRPGDPVESLVQGQGVPLGGYEVRLVDPETRTPVETGREGEIAVRGYTVMKGYYKDPEATARVMDGAGWFYTGDLGVFDERGYLKITGRRSDMFIVGGNNVHPADVERVLREHPRIREVQVVPAPHDRLGEVGVAFVEVRPGETLTEAEVIEHCRSRLASFKVPSRVLFLSEWPMTSTAKVERARLRRMASEPVAGRVER